MRRHPVVGVRDQFSRFFAIGNWHPVLNGAYRVGPVKRIINYCEQLT